MEPATFLLCSIVPQPTTLQRSPSIHGFGQLNFSDVLIASVGDKRRNHAAHTMPETPAAV
jgi:hypothetical protein